MDGRSPPPPPAVDFIWRLSQMMNAVPCYYCGFYGEDENDYDEEDREYGDSVWCCLECKRYNVYLEDVLVLFRDN